MRVAATKKMAGTLNKAAKTAGYPFTFEHFTVGVDTYRAHVDCDVWSAYDYGDFDGATGTMRAIEVIYPSEYCACPQYLTTRRLHGEYRKGDTIESFINRVLESVEI